MEKEKLIKLFLTEKRPKYIQINDLAALLMGDKKVVYAQLFSKEDENNLHELLKVFGFYYVEIKNGTDIAGLKCKHILIGTDIQKMKKAERLYNDNKLIEWGKYLDYPDCCVKGYKEWQRIKVTNYISLIIYTLQKSYTSQIPFYLNNTTNFYSRLAFNKLRKKMIKYQHINRIYIEKGIDSESFIIWHPCSYNCRESIKRAKKLSKFIKRFLPDIYHIRKTILSKPVLFKDDFKFVMLDGKVEERKGASIVRYSRIFPFPKTLISNKDINLILQYDMVKSKNGKIFYPPKLSDFFLLPFTE